jgi:hypothetical protein
VDRNWSMGVENVSPLIYSWIRCTRPRSVLEIGAGYSTLFIAQALADNKAEYDRDRKVMRGQVRSDKHTGLKRLVHGRHPLPLAVPEYYETSYIPRLSVIDDSSHPATSAGRVVEVARKLGLDGLLRFYSGDFRGMSARLEKDFLPFDLVWFDCGGLDDFAEEYWKLINPHGGFLLIHTARTNPAKRAFLQNLEARSKAGEATPFEMLSLFEPHKWRQNNLTILRMTPPGLDSSYPSEES